MLVCSCWVTCIWQIGEPVLGRQNCTWKKLQKRVCWHDKNNVRPEGHLGVTDISYITAKCCYTLSSTHRNCVGIICEWYFNPLFTYTHNWDTGNTMRNAKLVFFAMLYIKHALTHLNQTRKWKVLTNLVKYFHIVVHCVSDASAEP